LQHEILKKKVGQMVSLLVWRDGKTVTVPVQTGKLPDDFSRLAAPPAPQPANTKVPHLGFSVENADAGDGARNRPEEGARVHKGDRSRQPRRVGRVAGGRLPSPPSMRKPVDDAAGCMRLIQNHQGARGILLFLERNGKKDHAVLNPPDKAKDQMRARGNG